MRLAIDVARDDECQFLVGPVGIAFPLDRSVERVRVAIDEQTLEIGVCNLTRNIRHRLFDDRRVESTTWRTRSHVAEVVYAARVGSMRFESIVDCSFRQFVFDNGVDSSVHTVVWAGLRGRRRQNA
jgi:hypothetical protein